MSYSNIINFMDARNTPLQHTILLILVTVIALTFYYVFDMPLAKIFARTAYVLLFLILFIGPFTKMKKQSNVSSHLLIPISWRGELGIWFFITALSHFILIWLDRPLTRLIRIGGSGYSLANLIGLIALILTLPLAVSSFGKVITFMGIDSWRWLHRFAHMIFYLVTAHVFYFQFFSTHERSGPDSFGYLVAIMATIIVLMKFTAFITVTVRQKRRISGNPNQQV